jgi:aspartyl-tRNA(Asn)/glutamyl-tRNA(Gln) amidotransferase subunit B
VKEGSADYRYFPDPDIPKMKISEIPEFSADALKKDMVELPWVKRDRLKKDFNMTDKEAEVFVDSPALGVYYESIIVGFKGDAKRVKLATNYLLTDYLGMLKKEGAEAVAAADSRVAATSFAELISMIAAGDVSSSAAKKILAMLLEDKNALPKQLAEKHDLIQKSDIGSIAPIIEKVLADNAPAVAEYKAGKLASLQFLIGMSMKATKGAANPEVVKKLLLEKLGI